MPKNKKICRWCKFWKEPEYKLGGDFDMGYVRYIVGQCTVNPKHIETDLEHSCGQHQWGGEDLKEPSKDGVW